MINTPTTPTKFNPVLLDYCFDELTAALEANISWLDSAYGKIERFVDGKGRKAKKYPGIYIGGKKDNGYLKLFPDSNIGSFSYVEVEKQEINDQRGQNTYTAEFSIVFWFDFRKVFPDNHKLQTVENVKSEIMTFLNQYSFKNFRIRVQNFKEGANEVYKGFDHEEIESQFMMRPYGGFKVGCKISFIKPCEVAPGSIVQLPSVSYGLNIFNIGEAKTGVKYKDNKDIYVYGVELPVFLDAYLDHPLLDDGSINIIHSKVLYNHNEFGETVYEFNANTRTQPNQAIRIFLNNATEIQGNVLWWLYYTKN